MVVDVLVHRDVLVPMDLQDELVKEIIELVHVTLWLKTTDAKHLLMGWYAQRHYAVLLLEGHGVDHVNSVQANHIHAEGVTYQAQGAVIV